MDDTQKQTQLEQTTYAFWEQNGYFKADPTSSKTPYSLLMPPPNLTGDLHLGQAMQHALLDAIARFKRMQGYDVLLLPGVDHAGIQFESGLNRILSKQGLTKEKLGREEWLKKAWQFKDEVYKTFHSTWSVMGISADWSREVFTLEPKVQKAVLEEFKTFWDQDLLYKGAYIVQWCPKDATAIEDVEMEYEEKTEKLYNIRYKIVDEEGKFITVATARPETIAADVAIAIYPKHPLFENLVGKKAINPFTHVEIPIIEDERVEKEFGTGALKITPGHDMLDYQIGQTHNLPILHSIGKDGKITEIDPDLVGLSIKEGREKAAEKLRRMGLVEKEEDYTHSVPVCERCKTTIEPLISEEWFVKMKPLAEKGLKNISKVKFLPKNYEQILGEWIENLHDWSISRSLWWGHRIPVWYCLECNPTKEVGKDKGMEISLEKPNHPCPKCQAQNWIQDEQVLDTWFSSGMWPLATLGWPQENEELKRYYPFNFEITGPEIKYLWIARMIMLGLWFRNSVPFKNMFFHGTIRDLQGRKMSKSLGNGVDPNDLRTKWGTDAARMTLYSYSTPGRDGKLSQQTIDERGKNYRNFGTKLKNIYRFIYELKPEGLERNLDEKWAHKDDKEVVKKLEKTIEIVTKDIDSYNLHLAIEAVYEFIWHQFADVYLEKTKARRNEAQDALEHVFKESLKLLHPFMPFVTEELWEKIKTKDDPQSIMISSWPKVSP